MANVGNSFQTNRIMGKAPSTNTLPEDGRMQVEFLFANARKLPEIAGVANEQVVYVDVLLADNGLRGAINREPPDGRVAQLRPQAAVGDGAA